MVLIYGAELPTVVDIVQLVERQIVDLVVVGSSPSIHPISGCSSMVER